ncbi:hypothetical protein Plhal304r1_c002g0008721 [Plasmopara halstedii]
MVVCVDTHQFLTHIYLRLLDCFTFLIKIALLWFILLCRFQQQRGFTRENAASTTVDLVENPYSAMLSGHTLARHGLNVVLI